MALDQRKVQELLELTGGDPQWLHELLRTYVDDSERRLAALRQLVAAGHVELVQREAHGIKGSSSNIGACDVASRCHEMETVARAGDLAACRSVMGELDEAFRQIAEEIGRMVSGG